MIHGCMAVEVRSETLPSEPREAFPILIHRQVNGKAQRATAVCAMKNTSALCRVRYARARTADATAEAPFGNLCEAGAAGQKSRERRR